MSSTPDSILIQFQSHSCADSNFVSLVTAVYIHCVYDIIHIVVCADAVLIIVGLSLGISRPCLATHTVYTYSSSSIL